MEKNIDAFVARLGDPNLGRKLHRWPLSCLRIWQRLSENDLANEPVDPQKKFHLATELRDNIDIFCQGSTYPVFLRKLWPVFQKLLEGPPAFMSASLEHVSLSTLALKLATY